MGCPSGLCADVRARMHPVALRISGMPLASNTECLLTRENCPPSPFDEPAKGLPLARAPQPVATFSDRNYRFRQVFRQHSSKSLELFGLHPLKRRRNPHPPALREKLPNAMRSLHSALAGRQPRSWVFRMPAPLRCCLPKTSGPPVAGPKRFAPAQVEEDSYCARSQPSAGRRGPPALRPSLRAVIPHVCS